MKRYQCKIIKKFHDDWILKEDSHCIFLSAVLKNCTFKIGTNYILQVFLAEYKCIIKEKNISKSISDD